MTFKEFWPYYLGEHANPATRWWHFAGTSIAVGAVAAGVAIGESRWLLLAVAAGYGPAWISHYLIEKNRPATFKYPLLSLAADLKMWALMLSGPRGPLAASHPHEPDAELIEHQQRPGE